jgi:Zn-dependent peptidase ImmA (M78 family)
MISLPINGDVLKWARETRGLSEEEVADTLGRKSITAEIIRGWESGESSPNYAQLETLARKLYDRPLAVFFFPVVPDEETTKTEFRTLPDAAIGKLPPRMVALYRKAKVFQLNLEELCEGERPSEFSLLDKVVFDEHRPLDPFVSAIRQALGVSIEEQAGWRSPETAAKKWREAFEASGISVFKDAFRNDEYSGFCLYDQIYPLVFLNNSMPASRQVFTLFHELAHLLYRSGGVDFRTQESVRSFRGRYREIETVCNRFANESLVPRKEFDSFPYVASEAHFQKLADYFSVSREVIVRNYLDRGLVDPTYYERLAAQWAEEAKKAREGVSGGSYYNNVRTYLGDRYISLVYRQYYQNKIPGESLSEYLGVKARNLPTFEHAVFEGGKH